MVGACFSLGARMRYAILALALMLAACGRPHADDAAGQADALDGGPAESAADAPIVVAPTGLAGVWSFDRTCASDDAMTLHADGTARYQQWGEGTWIIDGQLLVLTLRRGDDAPPGQSITLPLFMSAEAGADLVGELTDESGEVRQVNAKRCPS